MTGYRYGVSSTIPDWILTVPLPTAIRIIHCNTPVDVLEAAAFQSIVHRSPGVDLPDSIAHQLSVGMKYMFYQPRKAKLINAAWHDFQRRLRWRLSNSFDASDQIFYDPDYDTRKNKAKTSKGPVLPLYMEMGLIAGRRFVNSTITKIPDEHDWSTLKPLAPNIKALHEFLVSNKYVITNTDKNLGIAVSERTWIIEKSLDILSNAADYRPLHAVEARIILDRKCTEMTIAAELADESIFFEGSLGSFLRSKVTAASAEHVIPTFYGIPKIHKVPTKMRPIIPCHSAIMNPGAKYVSKKLKPIVKSAPTIIHGTKDLAIKLSKLHLTPGRKFYIVTGDVVAFYPNIPLTGCLDKVNQMYLEHYWGNVADHDSDTNLAQQEVFRRCLYTGNTELICQFQDKLYLQLRGLAMGVADSPDLANLYGWYFERECKVLEHPLIPFYGRYIDDCIGLVYASSEQEALQIMSIIRFDGCTIEWQASDSFQPFLDMLIYRDWQGRLQHMPYRKAQSHQERIPWISHHPLDVKRGTFIGEMSRLATLSSTRQHYLDAMKGLVALYIKRGYPENVVVPWLKGNISARWESRLRETSKQHEEVLVLKTEYNTAWNYFNAKELGDTIFGYWRDWWLHADRGEFTSEFPAPTPDDFTIPLSADCAPGLSSVFTAPSGAEYWLPDTRKINIQNRRMITSRKRTRNLFDLTSLWKKVVLENLDELALPDNDNQDLLAINPAFAGAIVPASPPSSDDEMVGHGQRRHSPPVPNAWRFGAW